MPQSLAKVLLHIVFSTKNREPYISDELQPNLHAYLAGACRAVNSEGLRVGGTKDHVHIVCTLPRTLTISKLLEEIKKSSSSWVKDQGVHQFAWQAGYGAFSVSQGHLSTVISYIENQQEHHREKTYKEEVLDFLKEYNIECNEKYLWE